MSRTQETYRCMKYSGRSVITKTVARKNVDFGIKDILLQARYISQSLKLIASHLDKEARVMASAWHTCAAMPLPTDKQRGTHP